MARPSLSLAELVYRGTFRAERHAHLLLTEELPEEPPGSFALELLTGPAGRRAAAEELVDELYAGAAREELEIARHPAAFRQRFERLLRAGVLPITLSRGIAYTIEELAEPIEELEEIAELEGLGRLRTAADDRRTRTLRARRRRRATISARPRTPAERRGERAWLAGIERALDDDLVMGRAELLAA